MSYHYHINPCDFFLWGFLKEKVFQRRPGNVAQLRAHIVKLCHAIFLKTCVEKLWWMQGFVCKMLWGKTVVTLNMFFITNNFPAHSVPHVKCFCNNKNVLCVQSTVWHFVRHPPVVRHFTDWCAGFQLWSVLTVHDIYRIFHELQRSLVRLQHR
jgi:hypothetical protein